MTRNAQVTVARRVVAPFQVLAYGMEIGNGNKERMVSYSKCVSLLPVLSPSVKVQYSGNSR